MKLLVFIFILALSPSIAAQVTVFENIAYDSLPGVDAELLSLDVYIPQENGKKPIAIYVHGGGWCIGDKSSVHHKAELLTSLGYMFVSINYRLSPLPYELDNPNRIKYPDHPKDVAKAIAFVLDRASNYGGDLDNVFLFGHSSGAHLVATVLTDESFLGEHDYKASDIKCACMIDTGGFDLETWITEKANDANLFKNAFGVEADVWQHASPILHIDTDELLPNMLLIYQDNFERIISNQNFADEVRSKTTAVVSEISSPYDHQQLNQLLGGDATADEADYTQSFVDWLEPCMHTSVNTEVAAGKCKSIIRQSIVSEMITMEVDTEVLVFDSRGRLCMSISSAVGDVVSISNLNAGMYQLLTRSGARQSMMVVR